MHSLRDQIDEVYVADSILLEMDDADAKTLLLVEGQDDEYVFKRLVCLENCKVSREGGENILIDAIEKHNEHNKKGILAIKDSHFDKLQKRVLPPNILVTDGHDLEVMILGTSALEDFVGSRMIGRDEEEIEKFKSILRTRLFELGGLIGYLRFKSQGCSLADKINVHTILQDIDKSCELPLNTVVSKLKFSYPDLDETKYTQTELEELAKASLADMCRGHDLVSILSIIFARLSKTILGTKINPGSPLAEQLLATFNFQHFRSTDLHKNIIAWQEDNEPYVVLPTH